ncbi:hypothetical protein EVA_15902, partial [gut metagenome]
VMNAKIDKFSEMGNVLNVKSKMNDRFGSIHPLK